MLVEDKWCPGYSEDVWNIPDIGRHLFSVRSAAEHGIESSKNIDGLCFNATVSSRQQAGG
jgi:hypothetical protein